MSDPISLPVHKTRRLTLLHLERATTGDPDPLKPDVDDRGYTGVEHGPVVGMTEGQAVTLHLVRDRVDRDAPLFASSSDPSVVAVVGGPALPKKGVVDLQLTAVSGGMPKVALIKIHFGAAGGPVLYRFAAWVYSRIDISLTPHIVSISGAAGAPAVAPALDPAQMFARTNDLWAQVGLRFKIEPQQAYDFPCAIAGQLQYGHLTPANSELHKLFDLKHLPGTINVYVVPKLNVPGMAGVLGLGFARNVIAKYLLANPGVAVAGEPMAGVSLLHDAPALGHLLAHELGHFLGLWHPEHQDANAPRVDFWSRRLLMFPTIFLDRKGDWRDDPGYGEMAVPGGGTLLRAGGLVTQKNLAQLTTDGEAATARAIAYTPY